MSSLIKKKIRQNSSIAMSSTFEPSNFHDSNFSSLQTDDELKEITLQLVMIRKAYDKIQRENSLKKSQIEMMKKQVQKLNSTTNTCTEDQSIISGRMAVLTNQLDLLKIKLEEEEQNNRIYEHVLTRMKIETINFDLKSSKLNSNLVISKGNLDVNLQISRKNKEENVQSQRLLRAIKDNLGKESKNKEDLLRRLENSAKEKKEAAIRRQERIKRQAEIAEKAANENRNAEEIAYKHEIVLHKLYHMYLKFKQERLWKECEDIEEAFRNIRIATGLSSIQDIVEGFLKKEGINDQLKNSINESDKQLSMHKMNYEKVKKELSELILTSKESLGPYFQKFNELEYEITNGRKKYLIFEQIKLKFLNLYREVEELGNKLSSVLGIDTSPNLLENFDNIKIGVNKFLEEIKAFKESYIREYERQSNKSPLALYKYLHPQKPNKPIYIHDTSFNEELEEFITLDEE